MSEYSLNKKKKKKNDQEQSGGKAAAGVLPTYHEEDDGQHLEDTNTGAHFQPDEGGFLSASTTTDQKLEYLINIVTSNSLVVQ